VIETDPQATCVAQPTTVRFVRCQPALDPLAVSTFVEAGEEIACGDPSVTDAERAAAGRENLAERSRALLAANRRRAAAQYAAGGLPDDHDVLRVWRPRDPAALRERLGGVPLTAWAEDDILHVLWQGRADEVQLAAGVQPRLWPVDGADDLWEASLRIRRLDQAVIRIMVAPRRAGDDPAGPVSVTDTLVWRGRGHPPPCRPSSPSPARLKSTRSTAPRLASPAE
jgi:hypothetical protein